MIPLGDQRKRRHRIGANRVSDDWSGAVDLRFEVAEPRTGPAVARCLDHRVGHRADAQRTEILGDRVIDVEKISTCVVRVRVLKIYGIGERCRSLPLRLRIEIGDGSGGKKPPSD